MDLKQDFQNTIHPDDEAYCDDQEGTFAPYQWYIVIAVLSIIVAGVLPFIGSQVNLGFKVPNTVVGWIVFITTKLMVGGINLMVFHCFMQQAKVNVRNNRYYIEANEILMRLSLEKTKNPLGPKEWNKRQYKTKGITIAVGSIAGAFCISQAVFNFDWVVFVSYLSTLIMGVIFGFSTMHTAQNYWTGEYWRYAKKMEVKNAQH